MKPEDDFWEYAVSHRLGSKDVVPPRFWIPLG